MFVNSFKSYFCQKRMSYNRAKVLLNRWLSYWG